MKAKGMAAAGSIDEDPSTPNPGSIGRILQKPEALAPQLVFSKCRFLRRPSAIPLYREQQLQPNGLPACRTSQEGVRAGEIFSVIICSSPNLVRSSLVLFSGPEFISNWNRAKGQRHDLEINGAPKPI